MLNSDFSLLKRTVGEFYQLKINEDYKGLSNRVINLEYSELFRVHQ